MATSSYLRRQRRGEIKVNQSEAKSFGQLMKECREMVKSGKAKDCKEAYAMFKKK